MDAGIFVSYVGLFSYYNFDNWTYQPSYVSSNTPWFFNGVRIQYFPTDKLKICLLYTSLIRSSGNEWRRDCECNIRSGSCWRNEHYFHFHSHGGTD